MKSALVLVVYACAAHFVQGGHPCSKLGDVPVYDGVNTTCAPTPPAHGLAAMKWLVTPSPTATCDGEMINVLDKHPTCIKMKEREVNFTKSCNIIIWEDSTGCPEPSVDLVRYWLDRNCNVRYIPGNLTQYCQNQLYLKMNFLNNVLDSENLLSKRDTQPIDIFYILNGLQYYQSKSAAAMSKMMTSNVLDIKQIVMRLDYSCVGARGRGVEVTHPAWSFYHLYYYLSGLSPHFGRFEVLNVLKDPSTDIAHSRCFRSM